MPLEIKIQQFASHPTFARRVRFGAIPLSHQRFAVEHINRAFDKYGAGNTGPANVKRFFHHRNYIAVATYGDRHFRDRLQQRKLVNVLQCSPVFQHRRCRTAQQNQGCLRHLGIFKRCNRIGYPRACRHCGHSGDTGNPPHGIGCKYGIDFISDINHPDSLFFGPRQNR